MPHRHGQSAHCCCWPDREFGARFRDVGRGCSAVGHPALGHTVVEPGGFAELDARLVQSLAGTAPRWRADPQGLGLAAEWQSAERRSGGIGVWAGFVDADDPVGRCPALAGLGAQRPPADDDRLVRLECQPQSDPDAAVADGAAGVEGGGCGRQTFPRAGGGSDLAAPQPAAADRQRGGGTCRLGARLQERPLGGLD